MITPFDYRGVLQDLLIIKIFADKLRLVKWQKKHYIKFYSSCFIHESIIFLHFCTTQYLRLYWNKNPRFVKKINHQHHWTVNDYGSMWGNLGEWTDHSCWMKILTAIFSEEQVSGIVKTRKKHPPLTQHTSEGSYVIM